MNNKKEPGTKSGSRVQIRIIPFGVATHFSVQKPFGSSKIGHRSERFCVFLPIFAGREREGNEQKFGGEWDQAKQWSFCFEKKNLYRDRSQLVLLHGVEHMLYFRSVLSTTK